MKREIKFRATNRNTGEWCYGDLVHINAQRCIIQEKVNRGRDNEFIGHPCTTETIGQFTGLKDKNGREIYEGDIVRMKEIGGYGSEYIGVVRYYEKDCRFGIDFTAADKFRKRGLFTEGEIQENDGHYTITYTHEYEILGNVFDNPELLKGE
jgi:uncharacterized phage protein (TIGR01671 family)